MIRACATPIGWRRFFWARTNERSWPVTGRSGIWKAITETPSRTTTPSRAWTPDRTRFADERPQPAEWRESASRDSRRWLRQSGLPLAGAPQDVRVFEVDYPPTQEYKKRRVQEIFGCFPTNLRTSRLFYATTAPGMCCSAGYRPDRVTFFIWEGVTQYIPEDAVRSTLPLWQRSQPRAVRSSLMASDDHSSTG